MILLVDFSLYPPNGINDWETNRDATKEMADYIRTLTALVDLETAAFTEFVAYWGAAYREIGAADTAAREAVYRNAEQYLSLRELYSVIVKEHPFPDEVRLAAENVMGYFGLE